MTILTLSRYALVLLILLITAPVCMGIELSESVQGPFGILKLPENYQSHRATWRQQVSRDSESIVAEMEGSGCLRHFWLTIGGIRNDPENGLYLTLRIYFDGWEKPSVEMPVVPFFGIHHAHEAKTINSTIG